jgi:hypothetical protein
MCLACEMDALWFAEMEAAATGSASVPPALSGEIAPLRGGPAPAPHTPKEVKSAGVPPAVPGSHFLCEETRSE